MKWMLTSIFFLLVTITPFFAQSSASIKGKLIDDKNEAVAYANVILFATTDSTMVKLELSDDDGHFLMQNIPENNYWLQVSYVGLSDYNSDVFSLTNGAVVDLSEIVMQTASNDLAEVTVTAQRPMLELKPDKMVFNVDGSINAAGSDALELLRKSPGVVVDNNENVTLLGKSGVRVFIDGKPSPLSGDDLAAFLKTIQSSEIDAIEIITNPSAKYDAEGSAGIINIRMKKDKRLGANANINLSFSQGLQSRYNGSISTNYRNKKMNVFGRYNYYNGANENELNLYREQYGVTFDSRGKSISHWDGHGFKVGTDFFIDDKHTVGFIVDGNLSSSDWESNSRTPIGMVSSTQVDSVLIANSKTDDASSNYNFNINYRFDNGKERTWNLDADYARYRSTANGVQPNTYYAPNEIAILRKIEYATNTPKDIDIYSFKVDYQQPLLEGVLGVGTKFSYVTTDNVFDFYNVLDEGSILDLNRSNQFVYTENVNAAYINYTRQFGKIGLQTGFRMEQTNSEGDLSSYYENNADNVKQSYIDLFPSGGLTYTINPKNSLQFTYSRRINRPSYEHLNPFEEKLDELTFEKGNPFLTPEYSNNFQLTHSFNYSINTSLGYTHTRNMITRVVEAVGESSSQITRLNLASQKDYSIGLSGGIPITKWWSSYNSFTGYYRRNKADFGEGKIVDLSAKAFNVYTQHTFKLPKDFSAEISSWYASPSIWEGTFEMNGQWSLDAGVQKKLFDGKGKLKFSVGDIFRTNQWSGTSSLGALYIDSSGNWDSRRFKLSFSYLIGNKQVKSIKRKTGVEEEAKRIKTE